MKCKVCRKPNETMVIISDCHTWICSDECVEKQKENVSKCIQSINESMHELRTYKQFSGRSISFWWMNLNDDEVKEVYEAVRKDNDDFVLQHMKNDNGGITFRFRFRNQDELTQLDIDKASLMYNRRYNGFKFKESDLKDGELKDWAKEQGLLRVDDNEDSVE